MTFASCSSLKLVDVPMIHTLKYVNYLLALLQLILYIAGVVVENVVSAEVAESYFYAAPWTIGLWCLLAVTGLIRLFAKKKAKITRLFHVGLVVLLTGGIITHYFGTPEIAWYASFGGWLCMAGLFMLVLAMILFFFAPHTAYRATWQSLKQDLTPEYEKYRVHSKSSAKLILIPLFLLFAFPHPSHAVYYGQASRQVNHYWRLSEGSQYKDKNAAMHLPTTVSPIVAEAFGDLYVQYDGRICSLESMALDFTMCLYGQRSYKGFSAVQVLLGYTFYPADWEIIRLKPTDNECAREEQQHWIEQVESAQLFRVFPPLSADAEWTSWIDQTADSTADLLYRSNVMRKVVSQIADGENADAYHTLRAFRQYQQSAGADCGLPSDQQLRAEQWYKRYPILIFVALTALTVGLFFFVWFSVLLTQTVRKRTPRVLTTALTSMDVVLWLALSLTLGAKILIAGQIMPTIAGAGLHGMAWLAITFALIFSLVFRRKSLRGLLTAALTFLAGLALLVELYANVTTLALGNQIANLFFGLLLMVNLVALIVRFVGKNAQHFMLTMYHLSHLILTPAVFVLILAMLVQSIRLLFAGGAVWTWSVPEVMNLIVLMVYAAPVHWHPAHQRTVSIRQLSWFHLYLVLAFGGVVLSYIL